MGTIYKRGKTYWIKYYRKGRPFYESTETDDKADARKMLKKREGQVAEGRFSGLRIDQTDRPRYSAVSAMEKRRF